MTNIFYKENEGIAFVATDDSRMIRRLTDVAKRHAAKIVYQDTIDGLRRYTVPAKWVNLIVPHSAS